MLQGKLGDLCLSCVCLPARMCVCICVSNLWGYACYANISGEKSKWFPGWWCRARSMIDLICSPTSHLPLFFLNYFQLIPVGFSGNSPLLCLYLRYCCCKRSKSVTKMELSCQECSCFHVSPSWTCLSAPAWLRRHYLELHQPSRWQIKAPGQTRTAYHQQHMLAHTMLH